MRSLVLGGALILAQCGGGSGGRDADRPAPGSTPANPAAATPAPQPAPAPVTAQLERPQVKVLEPGAEPRASLRYDPVLDARTIELTLASTIALDLGIAEIPPTKAPALRMHFDTKTQRRDDGSFALSLHPTELEAVSGEGSGALAAGMQPTLDALRQMEAELVLEADGALVETTLTLPPTPDTNGPTDAERLQNAFAQLYVALPAEPIGIGARWSVTQSLPLAGARITQTSTFTLIERDGDRVKVELDLAQQPAQAPADVPAPTGDHTRLDALETTGSGTIVLDLHHFGPTQAHSRSHSEVTQTIERDGQRQQVTFALDVELDAVGRDAVSPDAP